MTTEDTTDPRVGTTFRHGRFTVRVDATADLDASVHDSDTYTYQQRKAWSENEWWFVGCIVTVTDHATGVELGQASLWGIENGYYTLTDEDDNVTGHTYVGPYKEAVDDLIGEAITEAEQTLARLCGASS